MSQKEKATRRPAETAAQPPTERAAAPKGETARVIRGGWSWGGRVMRPGETVTASAAQIADWRAAGVVE